MKFCYVVNEQLKNGTTQPVMIFKTPVDAYHFVLCHGMLPSVNADNLTSQERAIMDGLKKGIVINFYPAALNKTGINDNDLTKSLSIGKAAVNGL